MLGWCGFSIRWHSSINEYLIVEAFWNGGQFTIQTIDWPRSNRISQSSWCVCVCVLYRSKQYWIMSDRIRSKVTLLVDSTSSVDKQHLSIDECESKDDAGTRKCRSVWLAIDNDRIWRPSTNAFPPQSNVILAASASESTSGANRVSIRHRSQRMRRPCPATECRKWTLRFPVWTTNVAHPVSRCLWWWDAAEPNVSANQSFPC